MLINVNYLIKGEVNKKQYVNIVTLSCAMLYNVQAYPESFAAFAAKFQNAQHWKFHNIVNERVKYKLKS